jgi:hypothetical protein
MSWGRGVSTSRKTEGQDPDPGWMRCHMSTGLGRSGSPIAAWVEPGRVGDLRKTVRAPVFVFL